MREILPKIRRCWWIVALGVLLGMAGAAALTWSSAPLYMSSAKVYVSIRTQADSTSLMQGSQFAQQQIASYVQVATSPLVLQPVIVRLNLTGTPNELAGTLSASSPDGTSLIVLDATGGSGREAALVVNSAAEELIKALATLDRPTTSSAPLVRGTIIQRGVAPAAASSPKPAYNLGLGLLLGLLLGVLGSVARESWDNRVRNRPELTDDIGIPVLGSLTPAHSRTAAARDQPARGLLDEIRRIQTKLRPRLDRAGGATLLVTSAAEGEGKTTLATGLATAFAEEGARVLLIDLDLRTATLSRKLVPYAHSGLSTVLAGGDAGARSLVLPCGGFEVLPAGEPMRDPSALLTRPLITPVIDDLQERYDVIVLDGPALAVGSDAVRLSSIAATTVLVANTHTATLPAIRAAISEIDSAGGRIIGAVVNGNREEKRGKAPALQVFRHGRRSITSRGNSEQRSSGT